MENIDELSRAVGFCVTAFLVGYVFARLDMIYVLLRSIHDFGAGSRLSVAEDEPAQPMRLRKPRRSDNAKCATAAIEIDERKFVTKIDTGAMSLGSAANVGTTVTAEDKINESVSKLSQLKGK